MSDLNVMAVVFGAAVVNYLIRVTPFFLSDWSKVPLVVRRFLSIMPTAALTAHFSKNLIVPVAAAVAATWLLLQLP